jgi:alpha-1,6-mannosyltransferase
LLVPGAKTEVVRDGPLTTCTIRAPKLSRTSRYRALLNLKAADTILKELEPDIVESGDPYHLGWRVHAVGQELGIPVLGFYHSHFPEAYMRTALKYCGSWVRDAALAYARNYINRLYNSFDRTLVPSRYLAELLATWGVSNAVQVRLGVDTDVFSPAPGPTELRERYLGESEILLLYVGRLAGEKNTRLLLDSFRTLDRQAPGRFSLLIIGRGQLDSSVEAAQKAIPSLHWLKDDVDPAALADYYRAADAFVHPGTHETFGLVALESQACGRPVIGIRGSYMDANIFAGIEHWAREATPDALAQAITTFCEHDLEQFGTRASAVVRSYFGWQEVFSDILKIYEEAIEKH